MKCRKGKICYPTWAAAVRAMATYRDDTPMMAYRCHLCLVWHLTRRNRRKPRKKR